MRRTSPLQAGWCRRTSFLSCLRAGKWNWHNLQQQWPGMKSLHSWLLTFKSIYPDVRGMFTHSDLAPRRVLCVARTSALSLPRSSTSLLFCSLRLSPLLQPVMCLAALIWSISTLRCAFRVGFLLSRALAASRFPSGSACVLVISTSVAYSAGREATSAPLALTCQPTNCKWTLSKLRVTVAHAQKHTRSLCSFIWERDLSFVGGLQVLLAPPSPFQPAEVHHRLLSRI